MPGVTPIIMPQAKTNYTPILVGAGLVAAFFGYKAIKSIYEQQQAKNQLKTDQGSTISTQTEKGKKLLNLNGKPVQSVNLGLVATDIYNALHPGWYKPTDQDRAVRAFKNTPFGYVGKLEELYLNKYSENLKETLADKLNDENFIKIKYFFGK